MSIGFHCEYLKHWMQFLDRLFYNDWVDFYFLSWNMLGKILWLERRNWWDTLYNSISIYWLRLNFPRSSKLFSVLYPHATNYKALLRSILYIFMNNLYDLKHLNSEVSETLLWLLQLDTVLLQFPRFSLPDFLQYLGFYC